MRAYISGIKTLYLSDFPTGCLSYQLYISGIKTREKILVSDIAKYVNRSYSAINHFLNKYNDEVRFNSEFRVLSEQVNRLLT